MTNEIIGTEEVVQYHDNTDYLQDYQEPGNPDETEKTPIVNEQGEDVVNDQGYNHDVANAEETDPPATPEPGGDSPPPEIDIDPEVPEVEQPTMAS